MACACTVCRTSVWLSYRFNSPSSCVALLIYCILYISDVSVCAASETVAMPVNDKTEETGISDSVVGAIKADGCPANSLAAVDWVVGTRAAVACCGKRFSWVINSSVGIFIPPGMVAGGLKVYKIGGKFSANVLTYADTRPKYDITVKYVPFLPLHIVKRTYIRPLFR